MEAPVLVPHAAATGGSAGHKGETKYSYEVLFRSQHFALSDNACREYLFLSEFFHVESQPAKELFQDVLGKTCSVYLVCTALFPIFFAHLILYNFYAEIR